MKLKKHISMGLAAGALALAAPVVAAPAASAAGEHTIVFSNKSVVYYICFTSRDSGGAQVKHKCTTWAAGALGGTYKFRVPANAATTRFTAADRGTQMLGTDLPNTQDWCFRAPASWNGRIQGPVTPCRP